MEFEIACCYKVDEKDIYCVNGMETEHVCSVKPDANKSRVLQPPIAFKSSHCNTKMNNISIYSFVFDQLEDI